MDDFILINRIERLDHLHSLVRQDIKDLGIKLPKLKRLKKLNPTRSISQDDVFSSKIFGEPLYQIHATFISDYGYVPQFLIEAAKVVDKYIETEGLFRKSGSITRQKELQSTIDEGKSIEEANIFDITVLIKQFFRELPEPLFVTVYHESLIKCYNLSPDKDPKKALLEMCLLLPMENIGALRFTLHLLSRVASKCDRNKMTANNLAVVMAPNLLHLNKGTEKMSSGEEKLLHVHTCIIELLIKNWELVGMVSPALTQQLNMMSECFVTDDDPVASDDNTLEDSKNVLRRKKRKRSGSLTGLVSSIAHGIAKLRRSTDGKSINMTSNSYISKDELSMDYSDFTNQTFEVPDSVTPCVMKKRQACVENVPFSTSKRQAILSNLPQKSALASTPFTPASSVKKGNHHYHNSAAKAVSLNATTPALGSKASRKKLNLFTSPCSTKKVKRQNSACGRLESPPTLDKSGKGKNFFRRLSGSRAGKTTSRDISSVSNASEQMEEAFTDCLKPTFESTHLDSTVHELKHSLTISSPSSPSLQNSELSIVVVDDQLSPSNGFENDAGALMNAIKRQKYEAGSIHDTRGPHGQVVAAHGVRSSNRSKSLHNHNLREDPITDNKVLLGSLLTPQQQYEINNQMSATKDLKRSAISRHSRRDVFEIEKSEHIALKSEENHPKRDANIQPETKAKSTSILKQLEDEHSVVPNVSTQLNTSLMNTILSPPCGFGDHSMVEDQFDSRKTTDLVEVDKEIDVGCDIESVSGFSTISGGTVMRRTESGKYSRHGIHSTSGSSLVSIMSYDSVLKPSMKSKPLHTTNSSDSLFSVESRLSDKSTGSGSQLSRCVSSDSGKGSLLDDNTEDLCSGGNRKHDIAVKHSNIDTDVQISDCVTVRQNKNCMGEDSFGEEAAQKGMTVSENYQSISGLSLSSSSSLESSEGNVSSEEKSLLFDTMQELQDMPDKSDINKRRSISAENLGMPTASRASMRMRSHSIHISPGRKFNYKPHLEITRETHKLLARAGYFKPADDDFTSRYVQVEVKSPKRSSYREEMMLSLRSSFRERHNQMGGSVRSITNRCNPSAIRASAASEDKFSFKNPGECEKFSACDKSSDKDHVKASTNNIARSECLDVMHQFAGTTENIEQPREKLSFHPANETEKLLTEFMENHNNHEGRNESASKQCYKGVGKATENSRAVNQHNDIVSQVQDKGTFSHVNIKRADIVLQKHDSIVDIRQARLVTQSVRHFKESLTSGQVCNFAIPPVAKRGASPIKIPPIFAKSEHESNRYKHCTEVIRDKIDFKTRNKHQDLASNNLVVPDVNLDSRTKDIDPTLSSYDGAENKNLTDTPLKLANLELSESLVVDTATYACTPRSVKLQNKSDRVLTKSPLLESTNTSHISRRIIERVKHCTSNDLTPRLKDTEIPTRRNTPMRANWHNVKRLQNHSYPRKSNVRSPKSTKDSCQSDNVSTTSDTLQLFSSVDIQIDDKNQ